MESHLIQKIPSVIIPEELQILSESLIRMHRIV